MGKIQIMYRLWSDPAKLRAAKEHLAKAIARYKEAIILDPSYLPAKLGHAWLLAAVRR